jgi:hypothetical protein
MTKIDEILDGQCPETKAADPSAASTGDTSKAPPKEEPSLASLAGELTAAAVELAGIGEDFVKTIRGFHERTATRLGVDGARKEPLPR